MERIQSFGVDHMTLLPGLHLSRADSAEWGGQSVPVMTYDIRLTRPNFEPVMNTGEIHTIEHIGATYLRNREDVKQRVLYWGPMGCRTGFYLLLVGEDDREAVLSLMKDTFRFIADFEGDIPGATPQECGNYSDMDLSAAKARAGAFAALLERN